MVVHWGYVGVGRDAVQMGFRKHMHSSSIVLVFKCSQLHLVVYSIPNINFTSVFQFGQISLLIYVIKF